MPLQERSWQYHDESVTRTSTQREAKHWKVENTFKDHKITNTFNRCRKMYLFQWLAQPTDSSTNYKPTLDEALLSHSTPTALAVPFRSKVWNTMNCFIGLAHTKSLCAVLWVNLKSFCYKTSTPIELQSTFPTLFPTILQQEVHAPDTLPWTCLVHSCLPNAHRLYPLSNAIPHLHLSESHQFKMMPSLPIPPMANSSSPSNDTISLATHALLILSSVSPELKAYKLLYIFPRLLCQLTSH